MRVITLGEILLRLSTEQDTRLKYANCFKSCYGGGEANVGISLSILGHEVSVATILPQENPLSESVVSVLRKTGVNTEFVAYGKGRLGTYYLEQGNSQRVSKVLYDRDYSSFSSVEKLPWNLDNLFKEADVFHISGLVPALNPNWENWIIELLKKAKEHQCKISFDYNYRSKLWNHERAKSVFEKIISYVDILSAGKLDAIYFAEVLQENEDISLEEIYRRMKCKYPNIQVIYSTKRTIFTTNHHQIQGFISGRNHQFTQSRNYDIDPVIDRIGGGDAFSAGIIHGILKGWDDAQIVEFGTAASVLKHSVFGDWNPFDEKEILNFMSQKSLQVDR